MEPTPRKYTRTKREGSQPRDDPRSGRFSYIAPESRRSPFRVGTSLASHLACNASFVLVVGYIALGSLTKVIVGILGVTVLILTEGASGALHIGIAAVLIVGLLAAIRGWIG